MESEDLLHEFLRLGKELIRMRGDVLQFMNPKFKAEALSYDIFRMM
jgi:hypothetical protein